MPPDLISEFLGRTDVTIEDAASAMFERVVHASPESLPSTLRALQQDRHPERYPFMHCMTKKMLTAPVIVEHLVDELPAVLVDILIEEQSRPLSLLRSNKMSVGGRRSCIILSEGDAKLDNRDISATSARLSSQLPNISTAQISVSQDCRNRPFAEYSISRIVRISSGDPSTEGLSLSRPIPLPPMSTQGTPP